MIVRERGGKGGRRKKEGEVKGRVRGGKQEGNGREDEKGKNDEGKRRERV